MVQRQVPGGRYENVEWPTDTRGPLPKIQWKVKDYKTCQEIATYPKSIAAITKQDFVPTGRPPVEDQPRSYMPVKFHLIRPQHHFVPGMIDPGAGERITLNEAAGITNGTLENAGPRTQGMPVNPISNPYYDRGTGYGIGCERFGTHAEQEQRAKEISQKKKERAAEMKRAEDERKVEEREKQQQEEKEKLEQEKKEEERLKQIEEEKKKQQELQQGSQRGVFSYLVGIPAAIRSALTSPSKEAESIAGADNDDVDAMNETASDVEEDCRKLEDQMRVLRDQNVDAESKRWERDEKQRIEKEKADKERNEKERTEKAKLEKEKAEREVKENKDKGEKSKTTSRGSIWPPSQDDLSGEDLAKLAGDVTLNIPESQESLFENTLPIPAFNDSIQAGSRPRSSSFTQSSMTSFFPTKSSTMTSSHFEPDTDSELWATPSAKSPDKTLTADSNTSPDLSRSLKFTDDNYKLITVTPATIPRPQTSTEENVSITPAGGTKPVIVRARKDMGKSKSKLPVLAVNPAEKHKEGLLSSVQVKRREHLRSKYQISEKNNKKLQDKLASPPMRERSTSTKRSVPDPTVGEENPKVTRINSPGRGGNVSEETKEENISTTGSDDLSSISVLPVSGGTATDLGVDEDDSDTNDENDEEGVTEEESVNNTVVQVNSEKETAEDTNKEAPEASSGTQQSTQPPPQAGKESLKEVVKEAANAEKAEVVIIREPGYDAEVSPDKQKTPQSDKTGHVNGIQAHTPSLVVDSCEDNNDSSLMKKVKNLPVKLAFEDDEENERK